MLVMRALRELLVVVLHMFRDVELRYASPLYVQYLQGPDGEFGRQLSMPRHRTGLA